MGKRKERRFAANNTSRRVKLDLFAEPSGDLGGSDVRSDGDEKEQTEPNELPKSPSSSGGFHQLSSVPLYVVATPLDTCYVVSPPPKKLLFSE